MELQTVDYKVHPDWAQVAINRPEVYNALNEQLLKELLLVFEDIEKSKSIRCVVLTGRGNAFSSGQDLKAVGIELRKIPFEKIILELYSPLILAMRRLKVPVICKLNGLAAGAGCSLALAADLIIASNDAYLAEIFVGIGLIMDAGSTYFLPRILGATRAFELATTGKKVYGEEAEKIGLINKSVDCSRLDETVMEYVDYYRSAPTKAIGLIKEMLQKSWELDLEEVLKMEAVYQKEAGNSFDFVEGVTAFLQKRPPRFKGR